MALLRDPDRRDPHLAETLLDAVLAAVLTDAPRPGHGGPAGAAVALPAAAPRLGALSPAERGPLVEWLDRVVDDPAPDRV